MEADQEPLGQANTFKQGEAQARPSHDAPHLGKLELAGPLPRALPYSVGIQHIFKKGIENSCFFDSNRNASSPQKIWKALKLVS